MHISPIIVCLCWKPKGKTTRIFFFHGKCSNSSVNRLLAVIKAIWRNMNYWKSNNSKIRKNIDNDWRAMLLSIHAILLLIHDGQIKYNIYYYEKSATTTTTTTFEWFHFACMHAHACTQKRKWLNCWNSESNALILFDLP